MDRRIEIVINTIESHLDRPWEIGALSELVNLSPSRLRHLFKEETNTTLVRFIKDLRFKRAEFLLRTTFLTIKEVAVAVGLTSVSHFAREFKRIYGVGPSTYRINSTTRR
jgi:AraC family transcriptional regulator of arabinose operon